MKKYHGILVPVVTPLDSPGTVDLPAVRPFFDYMINGGVHGIFILGSTGEGPALSIAEQKKFILESVKVTGSRVPLLVGISGASGMESIELGRFALEAGADAVVAAPPCYIPAENEEEIFNYYKILSEEFSGKLFVYNMPALTKVAISPDLALRLLALPGVIGYKDSSGILEDLLYVLRESRDLGKAIFVGPEHLTLQAMLAGADGGVNGGANLLPELFSGLVAAVDTGDAEKMNALQREIEDFQPNYGTPCTCPGVIRALKRALSGKGLIKNILAFPNLPLEN